MCFNLNNALNTVVINQGRKCWWSCCLHSYSIGRIPEFAKIEKEVGILLILTLSTHFLPGWESELNLFAISLEIALLFLISPFLCI